ncbi:hypothetical protein [Mucilaginibacter sp.]|uniref:hypothetical protein n=1 Tax=Mucilaginibacter sp. TaxID=1882438 RepID=UPI0025F62D15|nr:hypothetical protein [Mucilaginibacter sp.]
MLKRSGAILLTVLYAVTVLGFALNLHYVGSKAASAKTNTAVINCSSTGKTNCCKRTPVKPKINDTFHDEATSFFSKVFAFALPQLPFKTFSIHHGNLYLRKFLTGNQPTNPREVPQHLSKPSFSVTDKLIERPGNFTFGLSQKVV